MSTYDTDQTAQFASPRLVLLLSSIAPGLQVPIEKMCPLNGPDVLVFYVSSEEWLFRKSEILAWSTASLLPKIRFAFYWQGGVHRQEEQDPDGLLSDDVLCSISQTLQAST